MWNLFFSFSVGKALENSFTFGNKLFDCNRGEKRRAWIVFDTNCNRHTSLFNLHLHNTIILSGSFTIFLYERNNFGNDFLQPETILPLNKGWWSLYIDGIFKLSVEFDILRDNSANIADVNKRFDVFSSRWIKCNRSF